MTTTVAAAAAAGTASAVDEGVSPSQTTAHHQQREQDGVWAAADSAHLATFATFKTVCLYAGLPLVCSLLVAWFFLSQLKRRHAKCHPAAVAANQRASAWSRDGAPAASDDDSDSSLEDSEPCSVWTSSAIAPPLSPAYSSFTAAAVHGCLQSLDDVHALLHKPVPTSQQQQQQQPPACVTVEEFMEYVRSRDTTSGSPAVASSRIPRLRSRRVYY